MSEGLRSAGPGHQRRLAHVLRTGADDLLDLSHHNDAGQHLRHLLAGERLRRVPHGAVGRDHRLRGHVVDVVATFHNLRAGRERGVCSARRRVTATKVQEDERIRRVTI